MNTSLLPLRFAISLAALSLALPAVAQQTPAAGRSQWMGYERIEFQVEGRKCWLVAPKTAAEGRPWIWRARFFGHEPQADLALLEEGFHLAYCDVANLFGSPKAVEIWNAFYEHVTEEHELASKPALEGMSRGGLIIYNWAAANPMRVACIYGDAPVCDFKSWPGGKGTGEGAAGAWQACLAAYGLTEQEAVAYKGNPVDRLEPLASAGVPLLHVVGDADDVVPVSENTAIVESRYRELGGDIQVIHKPGVGHHPHSLKDPGPIVAFVRRHTQDNVRERRGVTNARLRLKRDQRARVAFLGGSITEMEGYRPMVAAALQKQFPDTEFSFVNAGISSTCSTTGAFRLATDVLQSEPLDLLFVEFAVNDDQDAGHARQECIRGLEGIVRQVRRHSPQADIVVTYFVNPGMLEQLQQGRTPLSISAHEEVARHYGISSIHLAKEVAERISSGRLTWQQYGGTHPKPPGNRIAAELIERLWAEPLPADARAEDHLLPEPLDPLSYQNGRFVPAKRAELQSGWEIKVPDWKSLPGGKRARFLELPLLCADEPGAELTLKFSGTAVGAYLLAGPDAGRLEAQVDGRPVRTVELHHRFSRGLHYPRTVMFAADLAPGEHQLKLRIAADTSSQGHAARIIHFVAN